MAVEEVEVHPSKAVAFPDARDPFIRFAGIAGLLTLVLGIVINVVLLAPPPEPPQGLMKDIKNTRSIEAVYKEGRSSDPRIFMSQLH